MFFLVEIPAEPAAANRSVRPLPRTPSRDPSPPPPASTLDAKFNVFKRKMETQL